MSERKTYPVLIYGLPQMDQLVFKLILSVSQRSAARAYAYEMVEDAPAGGDFVVIANQGESIPDAVKENAGVVRIVDPGAPAEVEYTIQRPLIASRVLTLLDKLAADIDACQLPPEQSAATPEVAVTDTDDEASLEFCISEEEASQLAIVEDETLANPANLEDTDKASTGVASAPAPVADEPPKLVPLNNAPPVTASQDAAARVLVVDDSPSVRKQLELELNLFEAEVDYAPDAATTAQHLGAQDYDLVFLDVVLPDGDGFAICKQIKQQAKRTRVVMLTGKATPADKIKGTMAGCDAYLVKPVGRVTFQNTACNYLKLCAQEQVMGA